MDLKNNCRVQFCIVFFLFISLVSLYAQDEDEEAFVADAEAIYSYEGTKEINSLIVGRAITGYSAFVS